jgi:hypothetical protein
VAISKAGEIGHQGGGSFNPADYFAPPKAFIVSLYGNYYSADSLRDASGNEITALDIDISSFQIIPMFIWSPGLKFLGADVSTLVMPVYGQTSIAADLSAFIPGVKIEEDVWGIQDSYLQPLWLTWRKTHWDFSTSYGFWAPTGSYEEGALDNTGAGFWSHVLRTSAAWSPDASRQSLLSASLSYEMNGNKEDADLTPGAHLTLDIGAKHSFNDRFETGIYSFAQWQVTDDSGRNAVNPTAHDRLLGIGLYASYWFLPQKFGILGRHTVELSAKDRFEGSSTALGLNLVF